MATAAKAVKDATFLWEGMDKRGKKVKGQLQAGGEAMVNSQLRKQGITVTKVKKQSSLFSGSKRITDKDVTLFTRQLATMMKAGVPLLQSFEIVARGHSNPSMQRLLMEIKADIEKGSSLTQAFSRHPLYFDALFCNLVGAGESAGILEGVLERLAVYKEKILAIKSKIKSALFYPVSIIVVAFVITAIIMIFVIPAFKDLFSSFGADLPGPTLVVMAISDFFVEWWWAIFGAVGGGIYALLQAWKRSRKVQMFM
ncbi:MAG: type pilus assembly protein PilC, partial [Proteobacteria bacterium]|nr:type pilus assembly protein PilC [Pseudomonadota bacterium]